MSGLLLFVILHVLLFSFAKCYDNVTGDAASTQLLDFKKNHLVPSLQTTSAGQPVELRNTVTLNSDHLGNQYFLQLSIHTAGERVAERLVHAKGVGAFGYFEVTNDVSHYTSADVFNGIGKKTPLVVRLSSALPNRGGSDLGKDARGLAIKFYTNEGNLDFLCLQTPIYFYKDPIHAIPHGRARRRNPRTNLLDETMIWDFITLNPHVLHANLWIQSDYGSPRGFRKMNVFPIHTYEIHNKHGDRFYVKFNFRTEQGLANFTRFENRALGAEDPYYYSRDIYNAIAKKNYPSWRLEMNIMTPDEIKNQDYNPFDVTRQWRKGTYRTVEIGRLVLIRNIENHFKDTELSAFNPGNLVPGIPGPVDFLFKSRRLVYLDTQNHRLGKNHIRITVNKPLYAKTYKRDGFPPVGENMKDEPNYYPNSFNGPVPSVDIGKPSEKLIVFETAAVDLEPAWNFYNHVIESDAHRQRLVANIAASLNSVVDSNVLTRALKMLTLIDPDFERRVSLEIKRLNVIALKQSDEERYAKNAHCFEKNMEDILMCVLHAGPVLGQWTCSLDSQCADVSGSVCRAGVCACPDGQQIVTSRCVDLAPYHTSRCIADHQCSRMFSFFECRREDGAEEGECRCLAGHHYFLGRCWRTVGFGAACTADEECLDVPRDPYSLRCDSTCLCAPGYYQRQRGECRKIGYGVGDGCVLDADCQFTNGVCELPSMTCQLSTGTKMTSSPPSNLPFISRVNITSSVKTSIRATTKHGTVCGPSTACEAPFECSTGACVCPLGYYSSADGSSCYAELGSASTTEQCVGLLAMVVDGVCTCPANFFYDENMRDCIKVTRRITESCVIDENCHTFGAAAFCGQPQSPWPLRVCECAPELAVWEQDRQMCRLYAGVGEACEQNSDCLAGELEIQCVANGTGERYCACPEGFLLVDGLCLTTGLDLGESCQASQECTETAHSACLGGQCTCADGYQLNGDVCAPIIGGTCAEDSDCVVENTECRADGDVSTCQCRESYVAYNETCWPVSEGYEESCTHTVQCGALGEHAVCEDGRCECLPAFHFRDGRCWPVTGIFEHCSRSSQCYLRGDSARLVCRNSLCQCDFAFPYSEELHTCVSSATGIFGSTLVVMTSLLYLLI